MTETMEDATGLGVDHRAHQFGAVKNRQQSRETAGVVEMLPDVK
jgi:hypothetical protein